MDTMNSELFEALSNTSENVYLFEHDMKSNYFKWSDNAVEYFALSENCHVNTLEEWMERMHPDDRQKFRAGIDAVLQGTKVNHKAQYRVKNQYGEYVYVESAGNAVKEKDGSLKLFAGIITRLDSQAKIDSLTKKVNVEQFSVEKEHESVSVLMIGINEFRKVLQNYGFEAGEDILIELADELDKPALNQRVYRRHGEEFLVVLPAMSKKAIEEYFYDTLKRFREYCVIHDYEHSITLAGACENYEPGEVDLKTFAMRLENSMEYAKEKGDTQLVFFSKEIEEAYTRVSEISKALERAISNEYEGFEIYYQPILSVKDKKIQTSEALLRFHNEELGWVSPEEFIPILEKNRSIQEVGLWVMKQVIKQNKLWNEKYESKIKTGFNASYLQLNDDSFINQLIQMVEEYNLAPGTIVLELTESCKVLHPETLAAMFEKVMEHGILVALDDFGMGNSTLTLLRDIPVTTVKIDHSFVRTITGDHSRKDNGNLAVVRGIITMCNQLSYNVVVEGIESKEVAVLMRDLGADYLQGYYFSKPIPADEIEKFYELDATNCENA